MDDVPATSRGGLPQTWHAGGMKAEQAKADALITYAAKVKDWPLLFDAVDKKIEQQQDFVREWTDRVRSQGEGRKENPDLRFLSVTDAEIQSGIAQQQVSRWGKYLKDTAKYRDKLVLAAFRKAGLEPEENHRAEGTGDNQWFTPAQYIEAAREVMGGIDLDPASHPIAQNTVKAAAYFTSEDDGLRQQWQGRIWLNPPYAQPLIGRFVDKLQEELRTGAVNHAILLTHNYTDTAWFHQAEARATLICFTRGRIKFVDEDGDECSPTQGQAFFYYGDDPVCFTDVFSQFGFIR